MSSLSMAFDVYGFSMSPFGRGVRCCRCGIFYLFHPLFTVLVAAACGGLYVYAVIADAQATVGSAAHAPGYRLHILHCVVLHCIGVRDVLATLLSGVVYACVLAIARFDVLHCTMQPR